VKLPVPPNLAMNRLGRAETTPPPSCVHEHCTSVSVRPTTAVPQDSKLLVANALHELCVGVWQKPHRRTSRAFWPFLRLTTVRKDNIKMDLKKDVDWIHLAQDRAAVNT
jgi:hypothetical protein